MGDQGRPSGFRGTRLFLASDERPPANGEHAAVQGVSEAVAAALDTTQLTGASAPSGPHDYLIEAVTRVLLERSVPASDVGWPRYEILAPAADALLYTGVRGAFVSLIASAMDRRSADIVLPAHVEILKSLSADELEILGAFPAKGRLMVCADLLYEFPNQQVITAYRNILPPASVSDCDHRANIPSYVDNLVRLNLIYRPGGQQAAPEAYADLAAQGFVSRLLSAAPARSTSILEHGLLGLTDLGDRFRIVCL